MPRYLQKYEGLKPKTELGTRVMPEKPVPLILEMNNYVEIDCHITMLITGISRLNLTGKTLKKLVEIGRKTMPNQIFLETDNSNTQLYLDILHGIMFLYSLHDEEGWPIDRIAMAFGIRALKKIFKKLGLEITSHSKACEYTFNEYNVKRVVKFDSGVERILGVYFYTKQLCNCQGGLDLHVRIGNDRASVDFVLSFGIKNIYVEFHPRSLSDKRKGLSTAGSKERKIALISQSIPIEDYIFAGNMKSLWQQLFDHQIITDDYDTFKKGINVIVTSLSRYDQLQAGVTEYTYTEALSA